MLSLVGISKSFGATQALKPLAMEIQSAEILGVIGENGAGKSTLIKILSGVLSPDKGSIALNGKTIRLASPQAAFTHGIATIHQELACFDRLTVTENLLLNDPAFGGKAFYSWSALHAEARRRLKSAGLDLDPAQLMQKLSSAQRQEVAIARALSSDCKLLILDEPTASLTEPEVERLMDRLQWLNTRGVAILYVSHRLDEILRLTKRVAVLRDGELVASYLTVEAAIPRMISDMVGRKIEQQFTRSREHQPGAVVLKLENLSKTGFFEKISLEIREGEILGLAGLIGAGRSEVARAISGLYSTDAGRMQLFGKEWKPAHASEALAAGVVYIPEERKRQGFVLEHSVRENVSIGFQRWISRFGLIHPGNERAKVNHAIASLAIKTASQEAPMASLSGGNQQKALLGRWLETKPRVIILDEPTRGVDVGAKMEIFKLIDRLAAEGLAILLISSDLPELLALSDRVQVIYHGKVAAGFPIAAATQEKVLLAASGMAGALDQVRNNTDSRLNM